MILHMNVCCFLSHTYGTCGQLRFSGVCLMNARMASWIYTFLARVDLSDFFLLFFHKQFSRCVFQQLFVVVVWNFELYMIPLALLLPLAWTYMLIASGKDTRQDVVSNPIASWYPSAFLSFHCKSPFPHTMQVKFNHSCFVGTLIYCINHAMIHFQTY